MSVNALQRPSHPITVADELESFFHVFLHYVIKPEALFGSVRIEGLRDESGLAWRSSLRLHPRI